MHRRFSWSRETRARCSSPRWPPTSRRLQSVTSKQVSGASTNTRRSPRRRCGASPTRWPICTSRLRLERSEEHTSELQSRVDLVCRLLLEKKKKQKIQKDELELYTHLVK